MKPIHVIAAIVVVSLSCCTTKKEPLLMPAEARSFLGDSLYARPADSLVVVRADSAMIALRAGNLTEEDFLTMGRLLTSTNRFRAAIKLYDEGLQRFPDSYKLLRFRGHRYLNLREPDKAYADLTKAEALSRGNPDEWETDAAGKPVATYRHQIWYHIGVYHYLMRAYRPAVDAFQQSLDATREGKNIAGASDWLYNACQRAGLTDRAQKVARQFTTDFDIEDKNYPYFRRLLLYNGIISPAELIDQQKPIDSMSLSDVTLLYGLANYYAYQQQFDKANPIYQKVAHARDWQGFAVACAEMDILPQ